MPGRLQDIFAGDAYSAVQLTQRINTIPFQEGLFRSRLPWTVANSITPDIAIEKNSQGIAVISPKERGAPGTQFGRAKRGVTKITPPHYPVNAVIQASELRAALQDVADANGQFLAVQSLHDRYMTAFTRSFAVAWEYGAECAFDALLKDPADGSTILDIGATYGEEPQSIPVDYTNANFDWVGFLEEAKTEALHQLGGGFPQVLDWVLFCFGPAAKAVRSNQKVLQTMQYTDPSFYMSDKVRSSRVRFCTDVDIVTVQGTGTYNMTTATSSFPSGVSLPAGGGCVLAPVVEGLYDVTFTPKESFSQINGPGQEMYAEVPVSKITETSYQLDAESNVLHTIKRPGAILKMPQQ